MYVYVYFIELDFFQFKFVPVSAFGDKLGLLVQEHALVSFKMTSFSAKQRLQHLAPLVYADDLQTIDQVICDLISLSLYFHTVLELFA